MNIELVMQTPGTKLLSRKNLGIAGGAVALLAASLVIAPRLMPASDPAAAAATAAAAPARLTVEAGTPGAAISPLLYGIFFEEINRAGDGGIYAEMIQNRSFEDAGFPVAWETVSAAGGAATIALDKERPLNPDNPTSLRLELKAPPGGGGRVGVSSAGFRGVPQNPRDRPEQWRGRFEQARGGIAVEKGRSYDLSFYARADSAFSGPLTVSLERAGTGGNGGAVLASKAVTGLGADWKKFTVSLTAGATDTEARLVLSGTKSGVVWLDMVSLFPKETYRNRKNGLRADLMAYIERLKPAFVRFPGGCFVEGDRIENAFRWKKTIGDIAERPGHWNLWGYYSTDGLGYLEYLQMCEDLKSEPLFVINCGMSHSNGQLNGSAVPMNKMGEYVQDALDAIEYANGPVTSKWGALRAKHGHPAPFKLKLVQIGNENGGPAYNERYALFHDAIKKKYPEIELVACDWGGVPNNRPLDIIDPHLYSNPGAMLGQTGRFDTYDRKPGAPKIYFGEYAVTSEAGTGNLQAAVAEAAFMTGFERNGDVVKMSSYAPLLSHVSWKSWNPNAIVYDQARIYGTPSYHVQAMFSQNRGDRLLPLQVDQPQYTPETPKGLIGVGTWKTQAEYKDIQVTKGGKTLFASDFSKGTGGWKTGRGSWAVADGALRQTGAMEDARAMVGDPTWTDYTLTLKARKIGGDEGFLISFQAPGSGDTKSWWNLGGWNNTQHGLEVPGVGEVRTPGKIETGRWYDIRIELQGQNIKAYLDGKLVHDVTRKAPQALYAVAGRDADSGETILKVVNASPSAQETAIDLRGLPAGAAVTGKAWVLTSAGPNDENSLTAAMKVAPREEAVAGKVGEFRRAFPAHSVTVLRLKTGR